MTDAAIDTLLERLDAAARFAAYPPAGLIIWGANVERRELFRVIVRQWLTENQPESQR